MAQQPITDYPIDPVVTSGTQLADILNRTNQVLNSGNSGTSRPPMVTTGGLWVKTGGATPELYMFDGTADILIAASSQLDGFVAKTGDTMTGPLVVPNATAGNQALNQDAGDARYVNVTGDTVNGQLIVGDLVANTGRSYSDFFMGNDTLFNLMEFRNQSKNPVGYQKLPGGLILQWGYASGAGAVLVSFPITFPNGCASVTASANSAQSAFYEFCSVSGIGNSNFTLDTFYWNNAFAAGTVGCWWFAVGY
jgi:hypothetical protein